MDDIDRLRIRQAIDELDHLLRWAERLRSTFSHLVEGEHVPLNSMWGIILRVARLRGLDPDDLTDRSNQSRGLVKARVEITGLAHGVGYSLGTIGRWLNRNRTTVMRDLREAQGLPRRTPKKPAEKVLQFSAVNSLRKEGGGPS